MADYWISTGKHYCDFCKCWTADNKSSIQFHEKGKNHQANVKKRLAEIKKNSIDKRKKDEKQQKMFQEMEKAALAAVQKDINNCDVSVGRSDLRNVVKAHSKSGDTNDEDDLKKEIYPWQIMSGPQGTTYYYNSSTGESTWIVPEVVRNQTEKRKRKLEERRDDERKKPHKSYSSSSSTTANTTTTKTQRDPYRQLPKKEEPPEEVRDSHPLLGGWSTVKRYETEQNEEEEENQLSVKVEDNPSENTESAEETQSTTPCATVQATGKKFKEKQIKTSITTESDEPVAFKKRKSGQRNVRRRNDDD